MTRRTAGTCAREAGYLVQPLSSEDRGLGEGASPLRTAGTCAREAGYLVQPLYSRGK